MYNGAVLIGEVDLSNGNTYEVRQPIDGFTDLVIEEYEKQVDDLNNALDVGAALPLVDPVECMVLAVLANSYSYHDDISPERAAMLRVVSVALRELARTK